MKVGTTSTEVDAAEFLHASSCDFGLAVRP
jgi:hypothetical protein